jgi:1-acyl-sn-glycerol-3-phosphate acyltransferase
MTKVPIFGFIYKKAIVAVDRSSPAHRANSVRILKSIISKGISVLVFPEGTFNMTIEPVKHFFDGAFRVAIETKTPVKPVLFLDAYRRLSYKSAFSLTPGPNRILYLDEVPVDEYSFEDIPVLKEKVQSMMKQKMIDYDGAWRKE